MKDIRSASIVRVTLAGSVVNIALTAAKLIAGMIGHSSAMIADGIHSLSDLISDVIVLVFVKISSKGKDKNHDYGHGKFETLATLLVSLLLVVVAVKLIVSAVESILVVMNGGILPQPGTIALWAALVSIISKEILFWITIKVGKRENSGAVIANAWHHRSDALSSIGSFVGIGGAILLGGKWSVLDPVTGAIIGIVIIVVAVKMATPSLKELLEVSLDDKEENEIIDLTYSVTGVNNIHHLQTRRSGPNIIIDAHLLVNPAMTVLEAHQICDEVENKIRAKFGDSTQISLHIEPDGHESEH